MATFYVALFSGLAVALVSTTGLNTAVSGNTRDEQGAFLAAESGLSVLRYHITGMTFSPDATAEEVFAELGGNLAAVFNNTLNLSGRRVEVSTTLIRIPDVPIDVNCPVALFTAELTRDGSTYLLTVTGRYSDVRRVVRVTLAEQIGPANDSILRHGIASQGALRLDGAAVLRSNIIGGGSIMSLDPTALRPIRVNGAGRFDGDFFLVKEGITGSDVFSSGSSVFLKPDGSGYESDVNAHTHSGVDPPAWPKVDIAPLAGLINTLPHKRIERGTDTGAIGPLHNLYIGAGANPTFNSGVTITGMVYVEWPNDLTFRGSSNITGMIVCQPPPYQPGIGDAPTNSITFSGAVTSSGVENLPKTSEYQGLHEHTGTFLLAPDARVTFNGAMGIVNGTLYASELSLNGATTGRIRGTILVDRRRQFTKFDSVDLFFEVNENQQSAAGLTFDRTKSLRVSPGSYQEL